MPSPLQLFLSYAARDDALREELDRHLAALEREGLIRVWHRRRVSAGEIWEAESAARLDAAQIVLLLVSADYLAADDCFDLEVRRALERQRAGRARVIPVVVRACEWSGAPFAGLAALPPGGRPVASWPDRDEAWTGVARGVREAAEGLRSTTPLPRYPDARTSSLGDQLEHAYARRDALRARGFPTAEVDREIRELRRALREGGQLRPGDRLSDGRYLLLERIGQGGFGAVWRAHDEQRDAVVAVKVLHANVAADTIRRDRFFRGVRSMAALEHEAVVRVLHPGLEDEGYHYAVMELLPGGDLRRRVLQGAIGPDRILPVLLRVGEALALMHARGLVHRDIKPANIVFDDSGEPRLTDFDLVAAPDTSGGTVTGPLGTFVYAAPEMMDRPQDAGPPADVYSLAMTGVFGLSGRDLTHEAVRNPARVIDGLPAPEPIRAALKRAVELHPLERFPHALALCEALRQAGSEAPAQRPPSIRPGAQRTLSLAGRDLRGANFSTRDLRGADLRGANLDGTALYRADLSGADLHRASLVGASLSRAALAGARLTGANLSHAQLLGADLRGAELEGARLRYAALVGAALEHDAPARCDLFGAALPGARPALELLPPPSPRRAVAVSPDGAIVASAHADGSLRLARGATGAPLRVIDEGDLVLTVAFRPDGGALATGSADGTVVIWDPALGAEQCVIRGHLAEVLDVAFSPDGATLATASGDGTIRLWEASTGAARALLAGHDGPVRSVAWSPDGRTLASGSSDGTIRLWDPGTPTPRAVFEDAGAVTLVVFSPDGALVATGTQDGAVRVWDAASGDERRALTGHTDAIWSAAWSRDGTLLATRALDDTARIWDLQTAFELRVLPEWDRGAWREAALEGGVSAVGTLIRQLEAGAGPDVTAVASRPLMPLQLAWSPVGDELAVRMDDGTVRRWDLCAGKASASTEDPVERWFAPPPSRVSSHAAPGSIALFDAALESIALFDAAPRAPSRLGVSTGGALRLAAQSGASRSLFGHAAAVNAAAPHPDGIHLATASQDGTVRLWDGEDRCLAILLVLPGGWAALRPDGRYRLHGPANGAFWHTISLCRFEPGELDRVLPTPLTLAEDEPLLPALALHAPATSTGGL